MTRTTLAFGAAALSLAGCVVAPTPRIPEPPRPAAQPVSVEDVTQLVKAGLTEEFILARIRSDGVTARPTADQVVAMKADGVSNRLIEAMIAARIARPFDPSPPRVLHRYDFAPWWGPDPWWYVWPWHPYGHWGFHWRFRL